MLHLAEQLVLILGLSMDGFSAAVCMGTEDKNRHHRMLAALCLTVAHVGMLAVGWLLGRIGHHYAGDISTPLGAAVLLAVGTELLFSKEETVGNEELSPWRTAAISGAASMDALTVGTVFSLSGIGLLIPTILVSVIMGILSVLGTALGNRIGQRRQRLAKRIGGIVLCTMGLRMMF